MTDEQDWLVSLRHTPFSKKFSRQVQAAASALEAWGKARAVLHQDVGEVGVRHPGWGEAKNLWLAAHPADVLPEGSLVVPLAEHQVSLRSQLEREQALRREERERDKRHGETLEHLLARLVALEERRAGP